MNPVVLHVVRPYPSEQAYLDAEAWSIDQRGMVLIGVEALPPDTPVLFDIALADGQKPIRAEGRAVAVVPAAPGRPGGLKVRFKRFGSATKAFIERAVQAKTQGSAAQASAERPSQVEAERPSQVEAERPSQVEAEKPSQVENIVPAPPAPASDVVATAAATEALARDREPNRPRHRQQGPVAAPANRDELLARLRERRRSA
jgi:hypothetical protein